MAWMGLFRSAWALRGPDWKNQTAERKDLAMPSEILTTNLNSSRMSTEESQLEAFGVGIVAGSYERVLYGFDITTQGASQISKFITE